MGVLKTWTGAAWEEIEFSAMTVSASDVADLTPIAATTQAGTTYTLALTDAFSHDLCAAMPPW